MRVSYPKVTHGLVVEGRKAFSSGIDLPPSMRQSVPSNPAQSMEFDRAARRGEPIGKDYGVGKPETRT